MHNPDKQFDQTITLAFTGASGAHYGLRLLECLISANKQVYLMISPAAQTVIATETEIKCPSHPKQAQAFFANHYNASNNQLHVFGKDQWMAPVASGTNKASSMVVCPCSAGALAAIACGTSDNLIERAADVMLKERRQLILVPREMPLSAIHLEHMLKLARIGVTIMPANPGFYFKPESVGDLVDFVVARILDHLQVPHKLIPNWGFETHG
ncbi:MAG: UbiX family flavin prenyltransferase [Gammaproteobacteria bacterium]|nr:UbiX family flavin prenyltransferase [Gammaproteobacteria bacterium]